MSDSEKRWRERFRKQLCAWRRARKISQTKAAEELSIPFRTYQDWEYGIMVPRPHYRAFILDKLSA